MKHATDMLIMFPTPGYISESIPSELPLVAYVLNLIISFSRGIAFLQVGRILKYIEIRETLSRCLWVLISDSDYSGNSWKIRSRLRRSFLFLFLANKISILSLSISLESAIRPRRIHRLPGNKRYLIGENNLKISDDGMSMLHTL